MVLSTIYRGLFLPSSEILPIYCPIIAKKQDIIPNIIKFIDKISPKSNMLVWLITEVIMFFISKIVPIKPENAPKYPARTKGL